MGRLGAVFGRLEAVLGRLEGFLERLGAACEGLGGDLGRLGRQKSTRPSENGHAVNAVNAVRDPVVP